MSYLGNQSTQIRSSSQVQVLDGDGSTTAFTLSHRVNTASDLEVFVNNVQQQPTVAYTASETTLTFTEAPSSASGNIYIIFRGFAIQQVQAFTETMSSLADDSTPQLGGNLDVNGNDIVSTSNANIDILPNGSGKVVLDGNGSTGGVSISDGLMEMRSGTSSPAQIDFYCEVNNAHKVSLKSPAHADYSGNVVSTLPTATGTLLNQVASGGIYLGVTSVTASNLLNDYEEGNWTPSNDGTNHFHTTVTIHNARFTKVGRLVTLNFQISMASSSGNVGSDSYFLLGGLPFTLNSIGNGTVAMAVNLTNGSYVTGTISGISGTSVYVNFGSVISGNVPRSNHVFGGFSYFTDQ